ncbi:MAG: YiiX/YebB-like N1pC/P60 family cysteine hydrolase [Dysgonamonadaceae bacterium]|nr:YiiX/YebB-like N1pC/P60 family cysteine hydrolase [Sulfurovum sp.]MDD3494464.1 YiiX/YebB-like N1pC/P60 family cysteine hydrolase [Dysgonamonadaceae bacterium]
MNFKNKFRVNYRFYLAVFLLIIISILFSAFGDSKPTQTAQTFIYEKKSSHHFPDLNLLKNGDMVFRRGYGADSTVAMNFSEGEKRYSHAGIIFIDSNNTYVIHSEEDEEYGQNGVFKEKIDEFLSNSPVWAVYRLDITKEEQLALVELALTSEKNHILFDDNFNLKDDQKMYCSEFIYKTVNRSTNQQIITAGKKFMGRTFVTISNLYENKYTRLIQSSHKKILKEE